MPENIAQGEWDWLYQQQPGMQPNPNMGFPAPPPAVGFTTKTGQRKSTGIDPAAILSAVLGGSNNYGGALSDPDIQRARMQALMAMSANLLQSSGPSPTRVPLGAAIGGSIMAGQQAQRGSEQDALQALLLKSQIARAGQKQRGKPTAVIGPDGKPIFVSEEDAIGKAPYMKAGGEFGAYQPGDYTPASWAKFKQSGDPAELVRYQTPRQEYSPSFQNVTRTLPDGSTQAGTFDTRSGAYDWSGQIVPPGTKARTDAAGRAEGQITGARTGKAPFAYATYQAGVRALADAMSGTVTGPIAGRFPAYTAAQQTAEGSQAIMAPVLKQLFRDAGEGTFTDSDQAILMKMIPTRTDRPDARTAKLGMIDSIVRAKLGISETDEGYTPTFPASAAPSGAPARVTSDADYDALPPGTEFIGPDNVRRKKP